MNKETIKLATREEVPEVIDSVKDYLTRTKNPDAHLVGKRLVSELEVIDNFPEMFIFIARDSRGQISGVSNAGFDDEYGVTYHTLSIGDHGIGRRLLKTKLNYMLQKRDLIVAKPESRKGLDLAIDCGFIKCTDLNNKLFWQGDSYLLRKQDYKEF